MNLGQKEQQKNDFSSKNKDLLIELRSDHGLSWKYISSKILVSDSTLSRVSKGRKKSGKQLFAELSLLKELENLKRNPKTELERVAEIVDDMRNVLDNWQDFRALFNSKSDFVPKDSTKQVAELLRKKFPEKFGGRS